MVRTILGSAPAMATTPRLTSGNAKMALDEAKIKSQLMIISQPPPKQIPFTAAMTGLRPLRRESPPNPDAGAGRALPSALDLFHSVRF